MMSNRENAIAFLQLAGMGKVDEAYEKFVAGSFIHHNQYFKGDRQSLLDAMKEADKTSPNKSVDIKKIYEDGNIVVAHSLVTKTNMEIVVVHIFRFQNEKIVELWDVGQQIQKDSPNRNGIF